MATHAFHLEVVTPKAIDAESGGKAPARNNSDHRVNDAEGGMSWCSNSYSETYQHDRMMGGATYESKTSIR
jgi:hypothetical protein